MKCGAVVLALILIGLVAGTQSAFAVGYERYEVAAPQSGGSQDTSQSTQSLYRALQNATFMEKYPAMIDEVALFVKDVLGQFGLDRKTP